MHRSVLPCPKLPKQISVREHDYSIRLIRSAEVNKKPGRNTSNESKFNNEVYELTELFIEPLETNIVKVLGVSFRTNMPLEDVCHTDNALEITPIDDLTFQEELCNVSYLNETCKVCLKDLTNLLDKIAFFDDSGQISTEMTSISSALQAMNVEVARDDKVPQQMCIECYHIFSKMTLFKQICQRSKRALDNICNFTTKQLENIKAEDDDIDLFYSSSAEIVEIKEELEEIDPIPIPTFDLQTFGEEDMAQLSPQHPLQPPPRHQPRNKSSTSQDSTRSFICIRCGGNFPDQVSLLHHKRSLACVDESGPECRVCKEKLPSIDDLDRHLTSSHHCFPCIKCTKTFRTLSKYNKHQRFHETFICDFCAHVCYTKRNMRDHLMSHVVGLYPCTFCNQRFGSRKRLGIHKRKVHPNELYKCPHCSKEFRLKDTYRVHLMKHNPDKPHKCSYCEKQFVHKHHLVNHTRTHTKEYPFLCNFCGKTFRAEVALRGHLSIHDAKLYPRRNRPPPKVVHCNLCNFNTTYGNMKKHMINIHGAGRRLGNFEFVCHICDKEFRLAASLENHLGTHKEVRDFHCTHCKASFRKAHYLRLHIDGVHLKKRPNKCDQCDAAYLISNDLKRHKMQKHSTDRPFQCYYCQKTYTMAIYLKTHINRIHLLQN